MADQSPELVFRSIAGSRRSLAIWIWSVLLVADVVLITRQLSGDFQNPLNTLLAAATTMSIAGAAWAARFLYAFDSRESVGTMARADAVAFVGPYVPLTLTIAAPLLWVLALLPSVSAVTCGILIGVLLLQVLAGSVLDFQRPGLSHESVNRSGVVAEVPSLDRHEPSVETVPMTVGRPIDSTIDEDSKIEEFADEGDDLQTLWLCRRSDEGVEQVEGWMRVPFAAGQRETTVHLSFCPPLSVAPQIETEDLDGVGLEIRVAAVYAYGARLSVRRSGRLDERKVDRIGFIAQASVIDRAA
jgi:hypothetical protein